MSAEVLTFPRQPAREALAAQPAPAPGGPITVAQGGVKLAFTDEEHFWRILRRSDPDVARLHAEADADRCAAARMLAEAEDEITRARAIITRARAIITRENERLRRRAQLACLLKLSAGAGALGGLAVFAMGIGR